MKPILVIAALALMACGGEDGDQLLESEMALAYQGDSFEPMYGYAQFIDRDNHLDAPGHIYIGTSAFACEFDGSGRPENGVVVTIGLPDFAAGSYEDVAIDFSLYRSGLAVDQTVLVESVDVTAVDADVVSVSVSFAETVDGEAYSLAGRITALRCN